MTQKTLDAYTHKIELTTAITGKRVARASRKAVQDLQGDIDSILRNWQSLGKFKTRQEALDYLRSYDASDIKTVLESATRLKEPLRTEEIRRITAGAYKYRMTKARAVQETQRLASKRLIQDLDDVLDIALTRTARASAKDAVHDLGHGTKAEISFDLPNEKAIREVAKGTGVYDKIKLFSATEMQDVKELAVSGMLSGRSYADVAEDVAGVTGKEFYKARRLVRTTIAQASVDARKKTFQENGIEYYQIVCAHDERTCPICSQYDGKIFKLGEGPMPTFHPNCRCMIISSIGLIPKANQETVNEEQKPNKSANLTSEEENSEEEEERRNELKKYPERIAGVTRGAPMNQEEAIKGANRYDDDERRKYMLQGKDYPYGVNCQTCVVAEELRRRGYPVTAKPFDERNASQRQLQSVRTVNTAWIDEDGKNPRIERFNPEKGKTVKNAISWLDEKIGEGQRFNMFFMWKKYAKAGHIISVEKILGKIYIKDPQVGDIFEETDLSYYLDRVSLRHESVPLSIYRVDNAYPSLEIINDVVEEVE